MIANARKRADAFRIGTAARGVRGQRRRHHVLAEPPILESAAGALAADALAATRDLGAVDFRTVHLRQHAIRLERDDLHLTVAEIFLAARKHFLAREVAHGIDVEAGPVLGTHEEQPQW
jgi:hypothetical protein